jgi:hypothetical protein
MTLRKCEDTGNRKRKHYIALCGELALEEAVDVSQDGLRSEQMIVTRLQAQQQ